MPMPPAPPQPSLLRVLSARFDLRALEPPLPLAEPALQAAQAHAAWPGLLAWCHQPARWAVRTLPGDTGLAGEAGTDLAHALCLVVDGSLQLRACRGAAARLALRLRTKINDVALGRPRQPADPWDAGWLRPGREGLQALAQFTPRRPTLLVAGPALGRAHQQEAEALLRARQAQALQPLRLLLLQA